jgi:excisionase family DNA binding protein
LRQKPNDQSVKEVDMSAKSMLHFYTVAEVADLLVVSTRSVRRWIADGDLPTHRFGRQVRISEADLRAFVAEGRTP